MNTLDQPAPVSPIRPSSTTALDPPDQPGNPGTYERLVRPSRGWVAIDWNELYQSRDLFETLIMRDIRIRYKQTTLGVGWAVLQPLISMIVFTTLFKNFPGLKPVGVEYALFIFAGQVPWTFFTNAVTSSGTSLLAQQQLLTKIYFPRLFVPASNVGAYVVDLLIGLLLFGLLLPYYHHAPTWRLAFLPLVVLLNFGAAFGLGLILASTTVLFRDLRFIIPFAMQVLMFASPIIYPVEVLPERIRLLVALNPMSGVISAYRWSILGMPLDLSGLMISVLMTIASLVFGLFFFRRTERFFADLL